MNILHVIPYFNPKRGGDVNVCYNLTKQLSNQGHNVTVYTTDFEYDESLSDSLPNVEVIPFPCVFNFKLFLYSPKMKKHLKKKIKEFDIIHLHDFRTYQNILVHNYSLKNKIPYIIQAHGDIPIIIEKHNLKRIYDTIWGKKILKDAAKAIGLTKSEAKFYQKYDVEQGNIEIIPNGIEIQEYKNIKIGDFKNKFSIKDNEKIVLYIGRIHKSKGLDLLIDSFLELTKKMDNIKLVCVGPDNGYQTFLKEKIISVHKENKVLFTGYVSDETKNMAYLDSNIFVTPRFYGFPVTFIEAMSQRLPIITTNNGDNIDWISGNVGLVVDYRRESLTDAMFKILNDEDTQIKYGKKGKRLVDDRFTWDKIITNIENLYQQCL